MNCETASELLPELLAGALPGDEEAELLRHLACCAACRGELAFWAQVSGAAEAEASDMPDDLFEGVRERIFGERAVTVGETLRLTRRALGLAGAAFRLALSAAGKA